MSISMLLVSTNTHVCVCARTHIHTHTYTHMHAHAWKHTHTKERSRTWISVMHIFKQPHYQFFFHTEMHICFLNEGNKNRDLSVTPPISFVSIFVDL